MKKDAYYFPHDSNATNDPKIMMLIAKWGLEAYGIFWTIIEHLREQPTLRSHLTILKGLAVRYGSTEEKYQYVVRDFDLFTIQNGEFFYSKSLNARMKPLKEKREKMKQNALKRWDSGNKSNAIAFQKHNNCNTSKVKKSKVKESKEKNINKFIPPSLSNVIDFFKEKEYTEESAKKAFEYYDTANWKDSKGSQVKNWKQKMIAVWFKDENKINNKKVKNIFNQSDFD